MRALWFRLEFRFSRRSKAHVPAMIMSRHNANLISYYCAVAVVVNDRASVHNRKPKTRVFHFVHYRFPSLASHNFIQHSVLIAKGTMTRSGRPSPWWSAMTLASERRIEDRQLRALGAWETQLVDKESLYSNFANAIHLNIQVLDC